MYPYELERSSKKHTCPNCGKKTYKRVIEVATGRYLPDYVGRCDRESNCSYQYTWKQYFQDNTEARNDTKRNVRKMSVSGAVANTVTTGRISTRSDSKPRRPDKRSDYLEPDHLLETLTDYDQNAFVRFASSIFDPEAVIDAVKEYLIGTKDGFTVFPTICKTGKVCKAKLMKFDPATGKRIKQDYSISSLQSKLKKAGKLCNDFETDKEVFFGEHLLRKHPDLPVAVVESEKTAVIASICKAAFPDLVWLATGSKQWLKVERLKRLGRGSTIILYPDADGFDQWREIASQARKAGLKVKVSNLIETLATDAEKANQVDLADYLIRLESEINGMNALIDAVNNDPERLESFNAIRDERKAILIFDGVMSEDEAEAYISSPEYIREAIISL